MNSRRCTISGTLWPACARRAASITRIDFAHGHVERVEDVDVIIVQLLCARRWPT